MNLFSSERCHCAKHGKCLSSAKGLQKIILVGNPNVGKSVLFNALTGQYATVSNYPGTTVEVARGTTRIGGEEVEVIDTPGMYSLIPITEEEKVSRDILLHEQPALILHVIDAKNIERMLPFTLQLIETGHPVFLVLNMLDELRSSGDVIDFNALEVELHIPVTGIVAVSGEGLDILRGRLEACMNGSHHGTRAQEAVLDKIDTPFIHQRITTGFSESHEPESFSLEVAGEQIEALLKADYPFSKRAVTLFLLQEDPDMTRMVESKDPASMDIIRTSVAHVKGHYTHPLDYVIASRRQGEASDIVSRILRSGRDSGDSFPEFLSRLTIHPLFGLLILGVILYLGLYKLVGQFGAGTLVDFMEESIFQRYITPWLTQIFSLIIPWPVLQDLFVGEYGVFTLGLRYAVAIILPIVAVFFSVFSIIEDTGYLPRLALLIDRLFKKLGLSGRAVIPMVLGFGCSTMATMVTRTLPTKRERMIATLLLALAVPCSAQLGVILALLGGNALAFIIWALVMAGVFLFIGFLAARILPGERPSFYMEVPPLRFPKISNVFIKTLSRVWWYCLEVIPIFFAASALIWFAQLFKLFDALGRFLKNPISWTGLPPDAAPVFIFGFFRRDYGAAGLYDLNKSGALNTIQLLTACVVLALFLPCIAQFLVNVKERGWKAGLGISFFILFFSFGTGILVNWILVTTGVLL